MTSTANSIKEEPAKMYFVSITGFEIKNAWYHPLFWRHAIPSFMQAQGAAGNVFADTKTVNGIQHTLTAWKDKKSMLAYMRAGAHLKAMKISRTAGSFGKTFGGDMDRIPTWDEALEIWKTRGKVHWGQDPSRLNKQTTAAAAASGFATSSYKSVILIQGSLLFLSGLFLYNSFAGSEGDKAHI